eukprot:370106_1
MTQKSLMTPLVSMPHSNNIKNSDISRDLFKQFKWLNKFILYSGMWSFKTQYGTYRPKWCNTFGFVLVVLCMGYDIYYAVDQLLVSWSYYISSPLLAIIYNMSTICLYIAKICALWYYYKHFNFPWMAVSNKLLNENIDERFEEICQKRFSTTNKRMIAFLLFYFVACIVHYVSEYIDAVNDVIDYIWLVETNYLFSIPIAVSQCCSTVIFLYFELSLLRLMHILVAMDNLNDMQVYSSICDEYKKLIFEFNKETKFWTLYFGTKFLAFFCLLWVYISDLIHNVSSPYDAMFDIIGICFWMSPYLELVASASKLSSSYHSFMHKILEAQLNNKNQSIDENNIKDAFKKLKITQECNYLYNYVGANKLYFKLFGAELNVKNSIRLVLFFCGAKLISYSIYNI